MDSVYSVPATVGSGLLTLYNPAKSAWLETSNTTLSLSFTIDVPLQTVIKFHWSLSSPFSCINGSNKLSELDWDTPNEPVARVISSILNTPEVV